MARRRKQQDSTRRMLSLWEPPAGAGDPVGVLATTFTLDTALFEEECLARFAGVQSDPNRDGALYRIEREEKLAALLCAAVVADIHHCAGRRSLRWDLLASRPESGVMHAKISLLAWQRHVRAIVASANLTTDGYRRNQECAAVLDFDLSFADRGLLDPLLEYLREILDTTATGQARERAQQLLEWVDGHLPRNEASARGLQRRLVLVGPGRPNAFEQLDAHLPASRPETAYVVSPFFDQTPRPEGPEKRLWEMLRQRGDAELQLHVAGEYASETGKWRLQVPAHVLNTMPVGRAGVSLSLHPLPVADVPTDAGKERRPLHAKTLTLCHPGWVAWMVGSSNFTSAGTGMIQRGRNFEANVLYFLRADASDPLYRQLESGGLRGGDPVDARSQAEFEPAFGDEGEVGNFPVLPAFFAEANLEASSEAHHELTLRFVSGCSPASWRLRHEGGLVLDEPTWRVAGMPESLVIRLDRHGAPPSLLRAEWEADGVACAADWPVNVRNVDALPAPDELRNLSLAALLELLSSARPLHEVMRGWLRRQGDDDDADGFDSVELIDPHQKVDTSGFLVKRVQRACGALRQIRERLEAPVLSEAALAWRLEGPVGARAVVDAMRRQCDPSLPDEWAFLLCELVRELEPVRLRGGNPAAMAMLQARLDAFVLELRGQLMQALEDASDSMRRYAGYEVKEDRRETA